MSSGGLKGIWRPLPVAFALAAVLKGVLLVLWGSPQPIYDEIGYLEGGRVVAEWLRSGTLSDPTPLGRLAWHNPAYASLFPVAELVAGVAGPWIRLGQSIAGLLAGLILFHALRPLVPPRWALAGACALWFHPSMLFFGLTLWPVAFATLFAAAVGFCVHRLAANPDNPTRAWELGWVLAPAPFLAASFLCLLPLLCLWFGLRRAPRIIGPTLLLWVPWALMLSLQLGMFTPLDLAGPRNIALGNHPNISDGRGSLWGDPVQKGEFLRQLDEHCGGLNDKERIRCEARFSRATALFTVSVEPRRALRRAVLRILETWQPDRFLPRHFRVLGKRVPLWVDGILAVLHCGLLATALLGLRTLQGQAAAAAVAAWCVPILFTVGFTRLRQPLLPWLVFAAIIGLHRLLSDLRSTRAV